MKVGKTVAKITKKKTNKIYLILILFILFNSFSPFYY